MTLLSVAEAQARLLALASPLPFESVELGDSVGRWMAHDLHAQRNQPAHDLSAMDGYAIRYAERPGPWTVVGESAAGAALDRALAPGEAARIFTGAPVPAGADTILVQEDASQDGASVRMTGDGPTKLGGNIRRRGMDFSADDRLIMAGERIDARRIALAAIGGHGRITVRRRPRIALLSTGDELIPLGVPVTGAQLPASNAAMLAALLWGRPALVVDRGILPDRLDAIVDGFSNASGEADIIVTTGGVSVGDHDLVRPALDRAGARLDFWRVAMRPGKPLLAGLLRDTIILGLPGNPVSSYVTACLFLLPLLAHLGGAADPLPRTRSVTLGAPLPANGSRQDYLRARITDGLAFAPDGQDSSHLVALATADGLIVRPPFADAANVGDSAQMLDL